MEVLAKLAVISNAFLIAFTSDFIQKLVYKFHYGEVGKTYFENPPKGWNNGWLHELHPFPSSQRELGGRGIT